MATKLSEESVKAIAPPARGTLTVWDTDVPGFGVRVYPEKADRKTGAKSVTRSFFLNYHADGREHRIALGTMGGEVTAASARQDAKALRKRIREGENPAGARRTRREAATVRELADRYRRDHLPKKAARSQRDDWRMIEKEILPVIGDLKVPEVHAGDMEGLHLSITRRPAPITANKVLAVASKMFSLSLQPMAGEDRPWRDRAQGNPCQGVARNPEEGKERFFSQVELMAYSEALEAYGRSPAADALRLILLTGCRPSEALLARWKEFDDQPGLWAKPSAHTKQRKVHRAPLLPAALQLLDQMREERAELKRKAPREALSPFLFPSEDPRKPIQNYRRAWVWTRDYATVTIWAQSSDKAVARIVADLDRSLKRRPRLPECLAAAKATGLELPPGLQDARTYDLRHSFGAAGAGKGLSLLLIGRLLGHTVPRTTQRYAHLGDDPLKEALDKIGDHYGDVGSRAPKAAKLRRVK